MGNNSAARIPMVVITVIIFTKVNPFFEIEGLNFMRFICFKKSLGN